MAHWESLVDSSISPPSRPGVISVDLNALRTLLSELIEVAVKKEPRIVENRGDSKPQPKVDAIQNELQELRRSMKDLELHCLKVESSGKALEKVQLEIRDLKVAFETIGLRVDGLAICQSRKSLLLDMKTSRTKHIGSSLQPSAVQSEDNVAATGQTSGTRLQDQHLNELVMRIEALEKQAAGTTKKKAFRIDARDEVSAESPEDTIPKSRKTSCIKPKSPKGSEPASPSASSSDGAEHRWVLSSAFWEFVGRSQELEHVTPLQIEDLIYGIKTEEAITPDMMQELLLILSSKQGVNCSVLPILVSSLESSAHLTPANFASFLTFFFNGAFNVSALTAILRCMLRAGSRLTPSSLREILEMLVKASKIPPAAMSKWLNFLVKYEGLAQLVQKMLELPDFSGSRMRRILEMLQGAKLTTTIELVKALKQMPVDQLRDVVKILLQIPGYATEVMLALPEQGSVDLAFLVERLFGMPSPVPQLLGGFVDILCDNPQLHNMFLQMASEYMNLIQAFDGVSPAGVMQLFDLVQETHLDVDKISDFLSVLQRPEWPQDAIKDFIRAARASDMPLCGAVADFLAVLIASSTRPEVLIRVFKLLERSAHVTPESLRTLLRLLEVSGLLRRDPFLELSTAAGVCGFGEPSHAFELLEALNTQDFLTLGDLGECLEKKNYVTMQELEENMRRLSEAQSDQIQSIIAKYEAEGSGTIADVENTLQEVQNVVQELQRNQDSLRESVLSQLSGGTTPHLTSTESEVSIQASVRSKGSSQSEVTPAEHVQRRETQIQELQDSISFLQEQCKAREETIEELLRAVKDLQEEKVNCEQLEQLIAGAIPKLSIMRRATRKSRGTQRDSLNERDTDKGIDELLDLEQMLAVEVSDSSEEIEDKLDKIIEQLAGHETACTAMIKDIHQQLAAKVGSMDFQAFQTTVTEQLQKMSTRNQQRMGSITRRLEKGLCLSCDSRVVYDADPPPPPSMFGGLPPIKSDRPHTVFQTDIIRQQARSLREPVDIERLDLYSTPRQCGAHHYSFVEVNQRKAWTSEAKLETVYVQGKDGRIYAGAAPDGEEKQYLPRIGGNPSFSNTAPGVPSQLDTDVIRCLEDQPTESPRQ